MKQVGVVYFSPTSTTKRICHAVAAGMGADDPVDLDITYPEFREEMTTEPDRHLETLDQIVFGAPVYTGKLPLQVLECLPNIRSHGQTCTAVVVYGNRDYGIALRHLVEILTDGGFNVSSAGAFIGQHSYSTVIPVAVGRPNASDLAKACDLGRRTLTTSRSLTPMSVPVQEDMFSKSKSYSPLIPEHLPDKCTECGVCSEYCPVGIISPDTGGFTEKKATKNCTGCAACVSRCEFGARILKPGLVMRSLIKMILKDASIHPKEPLTIFP